MGKLSRSKQFKREIRELRRENGHAPVSRKRPASYVPVPLIACECGSAIPWDAPNRKCLYCRRKSSPCYASSKLPTVSSEPSP